MSRFAHASSGIRPELELALLPDEALDLSTSFLKEVAGWTMWDSFILP
jgi:hypothetical protein